MLVVFLQNKIKEERCNVTKPGIYIMFVIQKQITVFLVLILNSCHSIRNCFQMAERKVLSY